jgi:hypothetical protein
MVFLRDDNSRFKIVKEPRFGTSDFWDSLASDMFVGFSSRKILLCSGHRYPQSIEMPPNLRPMALLKRKFGKSRYRSIFKSCHPKFDWSDICPQLLELSEFPYLRVMESFALADTPIGPNFLEIGAGNAVSVAHVLRQAGARATIIDLPEMICNGYLLLRVIHPDVSIALPHEPDDSADVQYLLPYQAERLPQASFDTAFNMSSFQEMKLDVVNNYLSLIAQALKPGGRLILNNQERSRYIGGNAIDSYDFSDYAQVTVRDAPFHNAAHAKSIGLNMKHVIAIR